ncbi:MAG: transcription termination factor Rho [Clostridia bacterium]|nr:transcription termination factor Rho [Clostridia bacterium]
MKEDIYTTAQLDSLNIHDLRTLLRKLGGTPGTKNRREMMDAIIDIQMGNKTPKKQSNRGRKPKDRHEASDEQIEDPQLYRPYVPFKPTTINGENDYTGSLFTYEDVLVPLPLTFCDTDCDAEPEMIVARGILQIMPDGYGFLRNINLLEKYPDFFVDPKMISMYNLKSGDKLVGYAINKKGEKGCRYVSEVVKINSEKRELYERGPSLEKKTAVYPNEKFELGSTDKTALRAIDILAPIGKGQRALIVAPPKAGKTTLLQQIATSINEKYPRTHVIVMLIDERPEEVTDFCQRMTKGEVVASTFDESPERHVKLAELYLDRAKRLVESGKDVVILLDSITRLARACNSVTPPSGKTLTGGLDPKAMVFPKQFFGAARNVKEGGSLTIIATALIETGSKMDDVIYEEFKGTGNMELTLSRSLSERRIFPSIDLKRSGTRREELLLNDGQLEASFKLRALLENNPNATAIIIDMLKKTSDNKELLLHLDDWLKRI